MGAQPRIQRTEFIRVVEQAAAVVVDEAFRQRTLGDDHVVVVELDMDVFDYLDTVRLHDRGAVDQVPGFDQHSIEMLV